MENVLNNGMNNVEFEVFCANYQLSKEQKEIELTDFTCMILGCIEMDEDMGFAKAKNYHDGSCFNEENEELELIKYGFNEDEIWNRLFEVTGTEDYDDLEEKFKNCSWEDNENTAIITLSDDTQYAILRM